MAINNSLSRRRRKLLIAAATFAFVYTVVGFFVLPAVIKSQLLQRLPLLTKRQATVEEVKLNPYALSLTIRGLKLSETNGDSFASLGEFYGNVELSSVLRGKLVFSELSVKEPSANIIWQADGTFNFANLIPPSTNAPAPATSKSSVPKVLIEQLTVANGSIDFTDLTRKQPFHTRIEPLRLDLKDFTTQPNTKNPYSFTARTDSNEEFAWSGDVTVEPLGSSGTFKLSGIDLKKYGPYMAEFARIQVKDGKLDVGADYNLQVSETLGLEVAKLEVLLSALKVEDASNHEEILNLPQFVVHNGAASLQKHSASIERISIKDGDVAVRRNKDGTLNWLALLPASKEPVNGNAQAPDTNVVWTADIGEFNIDNFSLKAEDQVPAHPCVVTLRPVAVNVKKITWPPAAPMGVVFQTGINDGGKVTLQGDVDLKTLKASAELSVNDFALRTIQPYVEEFAKVSITSGTVTTGLRLQFSKEGSPMLKVKGDVEVSDFATIDQIAMQDLARFQSFKVSGIDADLLPNRFHVDEVALNGLSTSVTVLSNKEPNVLAILPPKAAVETNAAAQPVTTTTTTNQALLPFSVELGAFVLEHASFHFADHSITPHCSFDVADFGGRISGISSENKSPADVNISGSVDDRSTFGVVGKAGPISTNMIIDLSVLCTNTGLTGFTPYMEKFAGYPLQKGNLSVALKYDITGKMLKAENKVNIDQLTLGARNHSPDATKLPVKLGIALLKDRNGRIELDVPLSGSLDDPKFRIGPIVMQVVMNILTKAATSPFTLLGALFGGGEEMSFVDFTPGHTDISDKEAAKLEKLAKSLFERPELSLEITGSMELAKDKPALVQNKFTQQIKSLRLKELVAAGNAPTNAETFALERADYERLVSQLFTERFATNAPLAAPVAMPQTNVVTETVVQTNATPEPKRVVRKSKSKFLTRGAEFLFVSNNEASTNAATVEPVRNVEPITTPVVVSPSPEQTTALPPFSEMEQRLMAELKASDDDLRELMQERAKNVQAFLLKTGKLGAERLFLMAPPKFDDTFKGEARVNLSLN